MKEAEDNYTLDELCRLFGLSLSTYYYQIHHSTCSIISQQIVTEIQMIADETDQTYGKRRMKVELENRGFTIGVYKTASHMKKASVIAINPTKRHYYPDTGTVHKKAPNMLKREFNPSTINTHWVGDITYIRSHQGWSYLACVLDLGSKAIVGWAISQQPNAELAKNALADAIKKQRPDTTQLLFHSDQGVQYTAQLFTDYLLTLKITQSMSRRGNCWDNAVMERFFRSLKTEKLNRLSFMNHQSVITVVESYIRFYNYKRIHSAIGNITPAERTLEIRNAA
jgi:putative transposase